jgi:hypothetical protein
MLPPLTEIFWPVMNDAVRGQESDGAGPKLELFLHNEQSGKLSRRDCEVGFAASS